MKALGGEGGEKMPRGKVGRSPSLPPATRRQEFNRKWGRGRVAQADRPQGEAEKVLGRGFQSM
jgi:hypothetical protein